MSSQDTDQSGPDQTKSLVRFCEELFDVCSSILGYCQVLRIDAEQHDAPESLLADARKLEDHAQAGFVSVRQTMAIDPAEFCDGFGYLSHELKNQINHIKGQCDLMLLIQKADFFGNFADDLAEVSRKCSSMVATIDCQRSFHRVEDWGRIEFPPSVTTNSRTVLDSPKVLIVDDKPDNCEYLNRLLPNFGCECVTALSGMEALSLLRDDDSIDIVLLDFLMPEMNGFDVLVEIKNDPRMKSVSVIVVSGLDDVTHAAKLIENGADDFLPKPVDARLLCARLNSCMKQRKLKEQEYSSFFPLAVAKDYVRNPTLRDIAKRCDVTIMFSDIRGFSSICEKVETSIVVPWLSDVMTWLTDCVVQNNGVVVDFIGDEIMAMWGAPEESDTHGTDACRAAKEILDKIGEVSAKWKDKLGFETRLGIGLNSGNVSVGNTGSRERFKYGPLGTVVNVASRVQGATKHLRVPFLVTQSTKQLLPNELPTRKVCQVQVVNVERPVELFEAFPDADLAREDLCQYERALELFESGDVTGSAVIAGELLTCFPNDGPLLVLLNRIASAKLDNRPVDAVLRFDSK